ncbi:ABC transporter substrate-binding protein [Actinopolymorpha singaporensis]|uniref:Sulfonate transport system substrate-binding protein n=1 Tax=Actinopolymorpha singaporensis TaxID=117157 RepID=A0A1H1LA78_9ACTN|nr:ABC transporter substrate-binding protein [Actinopolymorpha singaporensis]SDR70925.1 sulfonate transport system substrate-binding protein [Actinopolymorpha singaporensis]
MSTPVPRARRTLRAGLALLTGLVLLTGCGLSKADSNGSEGTNGSGGGAGDRKLALNAPLPTTVPKGTTLTIGDPATQKALELSGQIDKLPFKAKWANLSGGPQTTEAFRAGALDIGSVADIPPIHATWTGLHVRIVAAKFRVDPLNHPIYQLGIAPGVKVRSLADLRGKRIAYSPGQAQGALVLRVLQKAGLKKSDVTLVELPSTGDVYPNALAGRQVDVAPIGGVAINRYLGKYGKDGGSTIPHGLRDDPSHLYTQVATLEDPAKAAAIRAYVQYWARAQLWIDRHPQEWIDGYYVKDQGLTEEDGRWLVKVSGHPDIPADWSDAIARQQQTVDLLARETDKPKLTAADLFDRRFAPVAADAIRNEAP